jgi:pimeloyl-ACP methyl ester carboxylesterase
MAAWINDVMNTIEASSISVVGHSQGCLVSMDYVARFPGLVNSVSFIASGYETPVNSFLLDAAKNEPRKAIDKMISWCFDKTGHLHQGTIPGNSMIAGGYKIMQGNVPNELFADLNACNNYKDGKKSASNIEVPCQLIIGGKDKMAPRKSTMALAETLSSSTDIEIIQESGHMVPLETPNQCRDLLKTFIFNNNPTS